MSDTVITALIGLVGSISAAVIGALVTIHIHNTNTNVSNKEVGTTADPGFVLNPPPRRRVNLAIPFTAIALLLAAGFGAFLASALRPPLVVPTPTLAPVAASTATPASVAQAPSATLPPAPATATAPPAPPATATPAALPTATTGGGLLPVVTPDTPTPPPAGATATNPPVAPSPTAGDARATPTAAPGVYGPSQRAQITPGVSLTINQMQVENGALTWRGTLRNDAAAAFAVQINGPDLRFQDNAGQPLGSGDAHVSGPEGTLAAHGSAPITFYGSYRDLPASLAWIDLVIDSIGGQGPFTFRRMVTLGTAAAGAPTPAAAGQQVQLAPGVSLVVSQMPVANGSAYWRGTFRNGTTTPFNFRLADADVQFTDSTGQPLSSGSVHGNWPDGDVAPGASAELSFGAGYRDLPAGVAYIDLTLGNLSGYGPFAFRRPLSVGPGPAATPTVAVQGARAVLTTGVYLIITQMQVQNSSVRWEGSIHNETNTPFNFRLSGDAVHFQDSTGQPLSSGSVQGNWPDGDVAPQTTAPLSFNSSMNASSTGTATIDLLIDNLSNYGPFIFRHPSP